MTTLTNALAIGYNNLASGKTITATTSATGFAALNLNTARLMSQRWHSTTGNVTNQDLTTDLTSSQDYEVVAALGTNLEDDATRQMWGDDDSGFGSPDWNPGSGDAFNVTLPPLYPTRTGWPVFGRHVIQFPSSTQNDRYVRIRLSDSGNADNYLRVGLIWISKILQLPFDFTWEPGPPIIDGSPGSQRVYRSHTFTCKGLTTQQKIHLESLFYVLKESGRCLIVPRPLTLSTYISEAIYGVFKGAPRTIRMLTADERWQIQFTFIEVLD